MGLFEDVKNHVTVYQVAERYGMKPNRSGLIRCVFHHDKTPSMKVDRRYYCFGCGCTGDVIDFAGQIWGTNVRETALRLRAEFGVVVNSRARDHPKTAGRRLLNIHTQKTEESYPVKYQRCVRAYLSYHALLKEWKVRYAPKSPEEEWNERFVEACQKLNIIEYYLDTLLFGEKADQELFVQEKWEEVEKFECRNRETQHSGSDS